jgi:hypothetical protein
MSFPPGTEMFQFPGFASRPYEFRSGYPLLGGFPHSEIHGSKPARGSPWLNAACHVLHRLSVPRHPPDALKTLDRYSTLFSAHAQGSTHATTRTVRQTVQMQAPPSKMRPASDKRPRGRMPSNWHTSVSILFTMSKNRQANRPPISMSSLARSLKGGCTQCRSGGGGRDRTDDLMLAKHALSQLSYAPSPEGGTGWALSSHGAPAPR